ncbi:MAG: helicase-related protein [Dysgonamonadaceae bacterium]|nr:helicase-related protein [Dysgonamonadaceae bacterium]
MIDRIESKVLEIVREKINRAIAPINGAIVFLKGFDPRIYENITRDYEELIDQGIMTPNGIDLKKLDEQKNIIFARILSAVDQQYVAPYELLQLLSSNFDDIGKLYKGSLIVIVNNYFDNLYPAWAIDKELLTQYYEYCRNEEERPSDVPDTVLLALNYYGRIEMIDERYFINYLSNEITGLNTIFAFSINEQFSIDYQSISELDNYTELSVSQCQEYIALKTELLYTDKQQKTINILVDRATFDKSTALKMDLAIFISLVGAFHTVNVFYFENVIKEKDFSDYLKLLNDIWGYDSFRELEFYSEPDISREKAVFSQGNIIADIIEQCKKALDSQEYQDIFITSSTGAGKSILYQLPALYLAKNYHLLTIVLSPLKALMKDQIDGLRDVGVFNCDYINSDLSPSEKQAIIDRIKIGEIDVLYISPEFLIAYDIRSIIGDRNLGMIIVDEAHLITTWGRDFRIDYWYLGTYLNKLRKFNTVGQFIIASFTATAVYGGNDDMVFETIDSLYMKNPIRYLGNTRRSDIKFEINNWNNPAYRERKSAFVNFRIDEFVINNKKSIVYFPYTSQINETMDQLEKTSREKVIPYYGKLDSDHKAFFEKQFRNNRMTVMLATKAFGMGVDISDIANVYHYAPTGNLCDYVQEVGRVARREDIIGHAIIDFHPRDLSYSKILYGLSGLRLYQLQEMLKKINNIYRKGGRRNFLVNAESFSYLFNPNDDIGNSVKSALLMIEKDLEKKYSGVPVLIVRPRSLFSKVYALIPQSIEKDFTNSNYGQYAKKIQNGRETVYERNGPHPSVMLIKESGDTFELDLKSIWENNFQDVTFPQLKNLFYEKTLFSEFNDPIIPRYKLSVALKHTIQETREELRQYALQLVKVFSSLHNRFFQKSDFISILRKSIGDEVISRKVSNIILEMFIISNEPFKSKKGNFIQRRVSANGEEFRIVDRTYNMLPHQLEKLYSALVNGFDSESMVIDRFTNNNATNSFLQIVYIIEAFNLGSYEVRGGETPEIFIRVNDPVRLNRLANNSSNYHNLIWEDVKRRQRRSGEILTRFFTELKTDQQRWDFIEDYFLGLID